MCLFFSRSFCSRSRVQNFTNIEAVIKKVPGINSYLKTQDRHFRGLYISNKKSARTKCIYFRILLTCVKSHQPRGNNKKYDIYFTRIRFNRRSCKILKKDMKINYAVFFVEKKVLISDNRILNFDFTLLHRRLLYGKFSYF